MGQELYVGVMSGTSLDGIDVVLVDFSLNPPKLVKTYFLPYCASLKKDLLALHLQGENELHRSALLANVLSSLYAQAINNLLIVAEISSESIIAIGCHGQTIRHCPDSGYSIQLFNPALLAELTGITVAADFRSRDIAAGGQGAPLVPAFHQACFGHQTSHRIIVNIGGIANITSLSPENIVIGFDCGPGNMLMDAWCFENQGQSYDDNGNWASKGESHSLLLEALLSYPFFSLPPPKSTGRDCFNLDWLRMHLNGTELPVDVQATLLELTVQSIVRSIQSYFPAATEIYLCGGGAHNARLVNRISEAFLEKKVALTDQLGIAVDWVEAFAFAWLARQTIHKKTSNLPAVTGAKGERILGAIYYA